MQNAPVFTNISSFHLDSVDVESHSALTQLIVNETARVNWVSAIWKKVEYVGEFKNKIIITEKPYSLAYLCLICGKKPEQNISCDCTDCTLNFAWIFMSEKTLYDKISSQTQSASFIKVLWFPSIFIIVQGGAVNRGLFFADPPLSLLGAVSGKISEIR